MESLSKIYKGCMIFAIGRNVNKYHCFFAKKQKIRRKTTGEGSIEKV